MFDTQTATYSDTLRRTMFFVFVQLSERFNVCQLCGKVQDGACQCAYFDDGNHGILREGE